MTIASKKTLSVCLIGVLTLFPSAHIDSMQSASYAIDQDSINFGGAEDSASASYRLSDTMGEVGTGESGERCASMSFNGTTDFVQVPHSDSLNITGEITVEAWIKTSYTGATQMIMEKANSSFNSGYNLLLTSQGFEGRLYSGSIASTRSVRDGQWHHVAMTDKSGAGGWNLYVDGVAAASKSGVAIGTNTSDLSIGKRIIDSSIPFYGQVDDVRVYNRALTAAEIMDTYEGNQVSAVGLAAAWGFDETSGTTISDLSGNANTGTMYGNAAFSSSYPSVTCRLLRAGYRQMTAESYIAISAPESVVMSPAIGGMTGGTGNGDTGWKVTTDNPAGYQVSVRASTTPALASASDNFTDYTPSGAAPDFTWSVASTDSEFGFSVEGDDTVAKFLDNGSACNIGSGNVASSCWLPFSAADQSVVSAVNANHPLGTDTVIRLRAQSGTEHVQENGTYTATITVTAVAL